MRLLITLFVPALILGFLCGLIQLIIASCLCNGQAKLMTDLSEGSWGVYTPDGPAAMAHYASYCEPASTTTSLVPRATLSGSEPSWTASSTTAFITVNGRTRRQISNECYSVKHAHGLTFDTMWDCHCYLVFASAFYTLYLLMTIWVRLKNLLEGDWWKFWIILTGLLVIPFLITAIGVGVHRTALPFWPSSTLMM